MSRTRKPKPIKRPYSTSYFSTAEAKEADITSHGAASSDKGAIRASVVRIFMGEYRKALVHDRRTGDLLYTIRLDQGGLKVFYGREPMVALRRVK